MRKSAYSAGAVVASAALLTLAAPTASQAQTEKELSICYANATPDRSLDLEVVADGPSFKTASLDVGDCVAWVVRPGRYKIAFEDLAELGQAADGISCPDKGYVNLKTTIKRMNDTYEAYVGMLATTGGFTTDIKKERRTSVTFLLFCRPSS